MREEFYESFLTPEYVNERMDSLKKTAKSKKAHPILFLELLLLLLLVIVTPSTSIFHLRFCKFRLKWSLVSSTSSQNSSMNFRQECIAKSFQSEMEYCGTMHWIAGHLKEQLWFCAALGISVNICWQPAYQERGSGPLDVNRMVSLMLATSRSSRNPLIMIRFEWGSFGQCD